MHNVKTNLKHFHHLLPPLCLICFLLYSSFNKPSKVKSFFNLSKRTMDSWKHACGKVMIQIFILTHLVDFVPFLLCHLVFYCFCCHIFSGKVFSSKAWISSSNTAGQKSQSVSKVTNTKGFQTTHSFNIAYQKWIIKSILTFWTRGGSDLTLQI